MQNTHQCTFSTPNHTLLKQGSTEVQVHKKSCHTRNTLSVGGKKQPLTVCTRCRKALMQKYWHSLTVSIAFWVGRMHTGTSGGSQHSTTEVEMHNSRSVAKKVLETWPLRLNARSRDRRKDAFNRFPIPRQLTVIAISCRTSFDSRSTKPWRNEPNSQKGSAYTQTVWTLWRHAGVANPFPCTISMVKDITFRK